MIKEIWNFIINKKSEKVEPPQAFGIIKLNGVAMDNAIYDDENKVIELHTPGKVKNIKYTEEEADSLREQGIPVLPEEYSDDFEFINIESGGVVYKR